jgi:hypothetical protein
LTAEPFIPLTIFGTFIFFAVLAAVYFYNQAFFKGDKINDIFPNGGLSPEFYTLYVLAFQMKPQAIFSISRPFSQDSGDICYSILNYLRHPHPNPPPSKGEGIFLSV